MKATDTNTLSFYDDNASVYAERSPHDQDVVLLKQFMDHLESKADVCDLGCGNGWASAILRDEGFSVMALDGSVGLATEANLRYGLKVDVQEFEDFAFKNAFDGLWACWSLHHAPRDAFPELLKRVGEAVRPNGILFISVKGGEGESRDEYNRFYTYYAIDDLLNLLHEHIGGDVITQETWNETCFAGFVTPMHRVMFRKRVS